MTIDDVDFEELIAALRNFLDEARANVSMTANAHGLHLFDFFKDKFGIEPEVSEDCLHVLCNLDPKLMVEFSVKWDRQGVYDDNSDIYIATFNTEAGYINESLSANAIGKATVIAFAAER